MIEKRGGGLSDRPHGYPSLGSRMRDVELVMNELGIERGVLMGISEGGTMCTLFAATHRDRLAGLVLWGAFARYTSTSGYPYGPSVDKVISGARSLASTHGTSASPTAGLVSPALADNAEWRRLWARTNRLAMTPTSMVRAWELIAEMDTRDILDTIHCPTVVGHRSGDRVTPVGAGRYLADRIPGAALTEFDEAEHPPWMGRSGET